MQVMFPKEEAQTAALEMRLSTAPISEVNEAELFRKTEQAVSAVFAAAGRRTDKKIAASRQIREIGQGIDYLTIAKDRLPYTEIAERLDQLQLMILSCRPTTDYLKNQVENLRRQWNHLRFLADFPIAEELDPDSNLPNVFHDLSQRIEELQPDQPEKAKQLQHILEGLQKQCGRAEKAYLAGDSRAATLMEGLAQRMMEINLE